jgi:hypothetical protein
VGDTNPKSNVAGRWVAVRPSLRWPTRRITPLEECKQYLGAHNDGTHRSPYWAIILGHGRSQEIGSYRPILQVTDKQAREKAR